MKHNHTAKDRTPYTYLLGWSKYNKFYYGSRYAKRCHPSDLWKTYKTSSVYVKNFVNKYGDPDLIEVRKIFDCPQKALNWEIKFLTKIDAKSHPLFLNLSNNPFETIKTNTKATRTSYKKGNLSWVKSQGGWKKIFSAEERKKKFGHPKTKEEKEHLRTVSIKRYKENPKLKDVLRQKNKEQFLDPIRKERHLQGVLNSRGNHKGNIWINNGRINKRIHPEEIIYFPAYWVKGRLISDENKLKLLISRGIINGDTG